MSVNKSYKFQALANGSDMIVLLHEYLKRGKDVIDELAAEIITLNTLAAEEEERHHACKVLMQQKDALEKKISELNDVFLRDKHEAEKELARIKKETDDYIAGENKKLDEIKAALDAERADLDGYNLRLDQRENSLKEKAATVSGLFKN